MKPPWLGPSREDVELESLHTDVMRFIAILGLCLAAIFSLVHSASQQPQSNSPDEHPIAIASADSRADPIALAASSPKAEPVTSPLQPTVAPITPAPARHGEATAPQPDTSPGTTPTSPATPTLSPTQSALTARAESTPETRAGFSLEFESVQALEQLLQTGKIQLYIRQADRFWSVDMNGQKVPVSAPDQYYQMQADTVPAAIRTIIMASTPDTVVSWGVALPVTITRQIQTLTASQTSGELLITSEAEVTLNPL